MLLAPLSAQEPENYYQAAYGKNGYELKSALSEIIRTHRELDYSQLWEAFGDTDADDSGMVTDMYNDCQFVYAEDQCGSGSSGNAENQCVCYNREHSMPKSWFHDKKPMYTDLFHLYPVSGYINTRRSNYPYGEVEDPTFTSTAGSRLGPCSFPGYSGTVFEPVDEYKGDFARSYFYMATCYEKEAAGWESPMLSGDSRQVFSDWAVELLLAWHELDPVSEKEKERNQAVYDWQGNRNPFIDYPELAGKIWGDDREPFGDAHSGNAESAMAAKCRLRTQGLYFHLDYEGLFDSVSVMDSQGRVLASTSVRQDSFGYRLPCAGLYVVEVVSGGASCRLKFVVR